MTEYLRFLFRNKYYILVEVIGISLAVAFAVPLLSFFSDKWEIDHGRDYRQVFAASPVGTLETTVGLGPQLAAAVPEIEGYAQVFAGGENIVHFGGDALKASCMADRPDFFRFFDIGFSAGTPSSLSKREAVLVSARFAETLGAEPVGQSLTLGLIAMSTYYVSLHRKETAIRKVYGATGSDELRRNVFRYLRIVLTASIFGLVAAAFINSVILQSYSYRLSSTCWVYLLALAVILGTAFLSVYCQARSVAMNNPACFIRDE